MLRAIAFLAALTVVASSAVTRGQQAADQAPDPAPVSVMSAADARAFADAAANKLDYLPGEVIVKFKDGVETQGQQRALDALRSRPGVDRLEWMGDVALLRDALQPDARVLAEQLAS